MTVGWSCKFNISARWQDEIGSETDQTCWLELEVRLLDESIFGKWTEKNENIVILVIYATELATKWTSSTREVYNEYKGTSLTGESRVRIAIGELN